MTEPTPVITVGTAPDGTAMVFWYRSLGEALTHYIALVASRLGVSVGAPFYLTDIPEEWIAAAKAAHRALGDGKDVSHLATHRSRFPGSGGPLDPVEPDTGNTGSD